MPDRYWVGGTASWDNTAGTKWAASSGGAGGESVPTTSDDVFFTSASTGTCTILSSNTGAKSLTCTGFAGTIAGSGAITIAGNVTLSSGMTFTHSGVKTITTTATIITAGKTFRSLTVDAPGGTVTLGDAMASSGVITVNNGGLDTANYNITSISTLSVTGAGNTRSLNLGSSALTISANLSFLTDPTFTFAAGTSTITFTAATCSVVGGNKDFYNLSFTSTSGGTRSLTSVPTINVLSFTGPTPAGARSFASISNNTTIFQLICTGSGNYNNRLVFGDNNTVYTHNISSVGSMQQVDFQNVTITGGAAPLSGTSIGNMQGNSGVTFDSPKTVFWNLAGANTWQSNGWSSTDGGSPSTSSFPLPQDIAIITDSSAGSQINITSEQFVSELRMFLRTSAFTLNVATLFTVYKSFYSGSGLSFTGNNIMRMRGPDNGELSCAGKTLSFTVAIIKTGAGTITLPDALACNILAVQSGTFNAATYNVTLTTSFNTSYTTSRTLALGSGTWTVGGSGSVWTTTLTGLTVSGTATLSFTSASAKTFEGAGVQTWPTINQGGAGALTITGSNKFANITNTYRLTGATTVRFTAGTTNEFTAFDLTGLSGAVCTLGSSTTSQANLKKSTSWYMGANSTDAGNNSNLAFTAGDGIDYLSVSYINGIPGLPSNGNFFMLFN